MDAWIFLMIGAFLCAIFLYYGGVISGKVNRKGGGSEAPEPAGAWPIIGHLHLLGGADQLLYRTLGSMADKYGSAFNIRLGSRRAFVVSSWEVAKECFTTNDKELASRPMTLATKHMGYNYAVFGFAPYTPFWREMRKIAVLELLSNRRLEILKHIRLSEIDLCIRELWPAGGANNKNGSGSGSGRVVVELNRRFEDMTLNVILRMMTGKRFFVGGAAGDGEARRCQSAINKFFHLIGIFVPGDAIPLLGWLDLHGHEKAMKATAAELDSVLSGWIDEHRERRKSGEVKSEGDQDFIDVMLSLEEQGHFSNFQYDSETAIKSTCLALILGGSDTTAGTLIWAISLLLNNRETMRKAQEEIDVHVGKERIVEESDVKNLVYIQAIIKETLRLYPAGPLLGPREAMEDCVVAGYNVRAGSRLIVNLWKIHRDPRVWEDPCGFKPDRFLSGPQKNVDLRNQDFELIPFGYGRRSCPGISFALQVLHLTLARILQAFDVATPLDDAVDLTESPGLTIPKATPLEVVLTPRLPNKLYI